MGNDFGTTKCAPEDICTHLWLPSSIHLYIFFCEGAGTHILKHSDSYIRDPGGGKIYKEVHTTPPPEIRKSIQDPRKEQI